MSVSCGGLIRALREGCWLHVHRYVSTFQREASLCTRSMSSFVLLRIKVAVYNRLVPWLTGCGSITNLFMAASDCCLGRVSKHKGVLVVPCALNESGKKHQTSPDETGESGTGQATPDHLPESHTTWCYIRAQWPNQSHWHSSD